MGVDARPPRGCVDPGRPQAILRLERAVALVLPVHRQPRRERYGLADLARKARAPGLLVVEPEREADHDRRDVLLLAHPRDGLGVLFRPHTGENPVGKDEPGARVGAREADRAGAYVECENRTYRHADAITGRMPTFDVLSQGEEILSGALVDTNTSFTCATLGALGLVPNRAACVGDVLEDIRNALREAAARSDIVVCTGGLGPTSDDLTAEAAALAFERELHEDPVALAQIEARYASRNRTMPPANRKQAVVPQGAVILENHLGTAPGFRLDVEGSTLFFLPGPPFEMRPMVEAYVVTWARTHLAIVPRRTVLLRCVGLPESVAAQRMAGFERPGVVLGYRAALPEVHVKLHLAPELDAAPLVAEARARLGDHVFGVDCGPLEEVVGSSLRARGETVAVAESCTGGRLGAALTSVPGASAYFLGGALVYSNAEKVRQCGVREDVLSTHGAVSEAVARALAEGIRSATGATWGVGVTGIAGPGGGTPEKPVGLVHLAVAGPDGTRATQLRAPYDRPRIMQFAVGAALDLLRRATMS